MKTFQRGNTYLAKRQGYWYVIQQISLKQWVATVFTHAISYEEGEIAPSVQCNAIDMEQKDWEQVWVYPKGSHGLMRKDMFDILKTGKVNR